MNQDFFHKTLLILTISFLEIGLMANELKPVMVSMIFRHGHRTPDKSAVYPNDPYKNNTYEPEGFGNLTPQGKNAAYKRGQMLRQNYSNLLSETYNPSDFVARSTNRTRTNMTLEYVIAGMYSLNSVDQVNIKNEILPSEYLYTSYFGCEKFKNNYANVLELNEVKQQALEFNDLIKNISECIGREVPNLFYIYALYGHLQSQTALELKIPNCFDGIYPNGGMRDASLFTLMTLNYNTVLSKLNGGQFVRDVTQSMKDFKDNANVKEKPRIYFYSGHDTSIAGVLHSLKINFTLMPYFCSAIMIELYLQNGEYFVKILYYPDDSNNFETLKLKNCNEMCPLDDFINLTKENVPSDEDMKC